jgi:catechol 2,3-dioxygenase-like lactoylglutathione lyase family enzyme
VLTGSIPALPVGDMAVALACWRDRLGFEVLHETEDFSVVRRDQVVVHLWLAADPGWRERPDLRERPVRSGAESFLAGTASCRIDCDDVDALYAEYRDAGVLHHVSAGGVEDTDFGSREFHVLDADGNLVSVFRWR